MKHIFKHAWLALGLAFALTACQSEAGVQPKGLGNNDLLSQGPGDTVHVAPDSICGAIMTGDLVDINHNTGSGNMFGADTYGTWEMLATPREMVVQVNMGRGWFTADWSVYMGGEANIPTDGNGNPLLESFPANGIVRPVRNNCEIRWPISSQMRCPNSVAVVMHVTLVELDFLGNAFNETTVWLDGVSLGSAGARVVSFCAESCVQATPSTPPCYENPNLTTSCAAIPALSNPTVTRTVMGGGVNINNANEVVRVSGNLNIGTVNFNQPGTLIIEEGSVVSGGINANNGGKLIVRGTFNWNAAANLNNTFRMEIAERGILNRNGDLTMNSQSNVLVNLGTLHLNNNLTYQGEVYNDGQIICAGINLNSNSAKLINSAAATVSTSQFFNLGNQCRVENCGTIEVGNNLEINGGATYINKAKTIVRNVTHNNAIFENYCYFVSGITGTADGFSHQGSRTYFGDGSVLVTRNFYWSPNGPIEVAGNARVFVAQSTMGLNNAITGFSGPASLRVNGGARLTGTGTLTVSDMNPLQQGDNPQQGAYPASVLSLINVASTATLNLTEGNATAVPF